MSASASPLLSKALSLPQSPSLPETPIWWQERREAARRELEEVGLPGRKHEAWRFTPVRRIVDTSFTFSAGMKPAHSAPTSEGRSVAIGFGGHELELPPALPTGLRVRPFREVWATEGGDALAEHLGQLTSGRDFTALQEMLTQEGIVIDIEGEGLRVELHHAAPVAATGEPAARCPRLLVRLAERASATLVEYGVTSERGAPSRDADAPSLEVLVYEIFVGPHAQLEHARINRGLAQHHRLANIEVRVDRTGTYRYRAAAMGGGFDRTDLNVRLAGEGSHASLCGLYTVDDDDYSDHHVRVAHQAPQSTSDVRFRGLADGNGHAVFDVIGVVQRDASGCTANQKNENLLLGVEATVDTKPHLEIDCDDVSASHGATVGALDESQLFYLRSRGISDELARELLTVAFADEILGLFEDEAARRTARRYLSNQLGSRASALEDFLT